MVWKYFNPIFEYEKSFPDLTWPWAGHKYFIYDFIRNIKQETIVELGTHQGTSFFSMCQAIKDEKINTKLYAVDTWQGEKHSGFYDESVLRKVKKIQKLYYSKLDIHLLKTTFDQAQTQFKNNSIDLLHIDGLHIYKAVNHDYHNWFNKVKKDGIIVLHDTFEKKKDFGVYKLWEEIKKKYHTIEFHHSHGLGIILLNKKLNMLTQSQAYWQIYYPAIYFKHLSPIIDTMQSQLVKQTIRANEYRKLLKVIKSSKFYKLWRLYCNKRDILFKK